MLVKQRHDRGKKSVNPKERKVLYTVGVSLDTALHVSCLRRAPKTNENEGRRSYEG